jgi:hypothetical protein
MYKIEKLSRFFKWVFRIILLGWPLFIAVIWFQNEANFPGAIGINIKGFLGSMSFYVTRPLPLDTRVLGFLVSGIPAAVGMFIAFSLMRLFACYEKGAVFTQESIILIRRIGMMMFLWALLNPIYQILMSMVLTWDKSAIGMRQFGICFDFDYVRNLIIAGIVFLIAHVMQEAIKLKTEQDLTV